jgi:short-subunit dehydrogenase
MAADMKETALVTGASRGIGRAIADVLLESGYEVTGIGRHFQTEEKEHFHAVELDLMDDRKLHAFMDAYDSADLHVLVNCAGSAYYGMHEEIHPDQLREMIQVDLEVPMVLCGRYLRTLRKNQGTIINVASVTAVDGAPHAAAYGAVKAGLLSFDRSLMKENRKFGMKVVTLLPDLTDTALYRHADFAPKEGCVLQPEEVADAVRFILQDPNRIVEEMVIRSQYNGIERKKNRYGKGKD